MKKICLIVLMAVSLMLTLTSSVQAQTPQESLAQYISELQKNPNDAALRGKIIKHVQAMKHAPAIPEEARRHYVKAITLFKNAKQPSDSADAAEEFRQALLIAPWWGDAYMKMGLTLETAQRYDDAIASLKLFMVTNPQDEVLRKAQDEIYAIEALAEKAAKDKELAARNVAEEQRAQQAEAEAKKAREQDAWLIKLDGARYSYSFRDDDGTTITWALEIRGKTLIKTTNAFKDRQWGEEGRYEISAREFVRNYPNMKETFRISETAITLTEENNNGSNRNTQIYSRER